MTKVILQKTICILLMICSHSLYGQIEIAKTGKFLFVDKEERYIVYFQPNSKEADEFIEGRILIYNIRKDSCFVLNLETYILDLIDIKAGESDFFFLSNGKSILKYSLSTQERRQVYKVGGNDVIRNFSVSSDKSSLIITTLNTSSNVYKVLVYKIGGRKSQEIFSQQYDSKGEFLGIETLMNMDKIYLRSLDNKLFCLASGKSEIIDSNVLDLLQITDSYLYYSKKNSIVEYTLSSRKGLEIIKSEPLRISFFNPYEKGLFISFNDNVFVYNKMKKTIKSIEELPKNEYVFFSENIAIYQGIGHSLHLLNNHP